MFKRIITIFKINFMPDFGLKERNNMSEQQSQTEQSDEISTNDKEARLKVFERSVLEGRHTDEDSSTAPLPSNYPYRTLMRRSTYER